MASLLMFLPVIALISCMNAYEDLSNTDRVNRAVNLIKQERIPNLQYGVLLKKIRVLDMSASTWPHLFRIPHIPALPKLHHYDVCSNIPSRLLTMAANRSWHNAEQMKKMLFPYEQRLKRFCDHYKTLENHYNNLMVQMTKEIKRQYLTMQRLVLPNKSTVRRTTREACGNATGEIRSDMDDFPCHNGTGQSRDKRALEFIGEGLGNFFGLASTADLRKLWNAVQLIHNNAVDFRGKFTKFSESMMTITNINKQKLEHLNETVVKAVNNLNTLHQRLRDFHSELRLESTYNTLIQHIFIDALSDISILQDAVGSYLDQVQDRIMALTSLNHHLLTPALVTPGQLKDALKRIEPELLKNYAPFRFAFDSIDYFYSVPSTTYLADEDSLYVEINIPLTVISAHYHIYEVHTVPLTAGHGTTQFTEIVGLNKYLGVSVHGDTYVTFDDKFLTSCSGVGVQRCSTRLMETSILAPSCILGLFLGDNNMTATHCHMELILTSSLPETAIDIGHGHFFISAMDIRSDWVIACPHRKPRTIMACRSCVISLDCRCNLKTPSGFISASLTGCTNSSSTSGIVKNYVPNLMWIQSLANFTNRNYSALVNASLLTYDPIDQLPDLPIPNFSQVAAFADKDAEIRTDLHTVLNQAHHEQQVYVSKLQELTSDTRFLLFRTDHALPMAMVALVWDLILTIIMIILCRRYVFVHMILRKMSAVTASSATPDEVAESYCLWYIATMLSLYILACLALYIYRRRRLYLASNTHYPIAMHDQLSTDVYLKFWTGLRLAVIHIDHILASQDTLDLENSPILPTQPVKRLPSVYVTPKYAWFTMKVNLEWSTTTLIHKPSKLVIPLPPTAPVPRPVQNILYSILRDKYHLALILRTGPIQKEIELKPAPPMKVLPADMDRLHVATRPKYRPPPARPPPPKKRSFTRSGRLPQNPLSGVSPSTSTRSAYSPAKPPHRAKTASFTSLPTLNTTPPPFHRQLSVLETEPPSPTGSLYNELDELD